MTKPTYAYVKTGTDQLRSNCEADQRLCFCYIDNRIPLQTTLLVFMTRLISPAGIVHEFDENGLTISNPDWCQCIPVELIKVTQEIVHQWDRGLQEFVSSSDWSKER